MSTGTEHKQILYAVLNWGLGHAARSLPLISDLHRKGNKLLLASSGNVLNLLKKECPGLKYLKLPDYGVKYHSSSMTANMLLSSPAILKAIYREKQITKKITEDYKPDYIISDSRFGVYSNKVKSILISHQLNLKTGNRLQDTLVQKINSSWHSRFDEIWVPDVNEKLNLSGDLSHPSPYQNTKYIGPLTRFKGSHESEKVIKYDWIIVLSGPEPAKSRFKEKLIKLLEPGSLRILMITGNSGEEGEVRHGFEIKGLLQAHQIYQYAQKSRFFCGRSGYSTILDLTALKMPALLIPTPGQYEQVYLAEHLSKKGMFSSVHENNLTAKHFNPLQEFNSEIPEMNVDIEFLLSS